MDIIIRHRYRLSWMPLRIILFRTHLTLLFPHWQLAVTIACTTYTIGLVWLWYEWLRNNPRLIHPSLVYIETILKLSDPARNLFCRSAIYYSCLLLLHISLRTSDNFITVIIISTATLWERPQKYSITWILLFIRGFYQ